MFHILIWGSLEHCLGGLSPPWRQVWVRSTPRYGSRTNCLCKK